MENEGYEEESCTPKNRGYFAQSSKQTSHDDDDIRQTIPDNSNPLLRNDPESHHLYEDIVISGLLNSTNDSSSLPPGNFSDSANPANDNCHICEKLENLDRSKNVVKEEEKNLRNSTKSAKCFSSIETRKNSSNFQRNFTLPLRRPIGTIETGADGPSSRFSCRVTDRERRPAFSNDNYSSSINESSMKILDDDLTRSNNATSRVLDKPAGRRRRKKDCKHCKSKANLTLVTIPHNFSNNHRERERSIEDTSSSSSSSSSPPSSFIIDASRKIRASLNNDTKVIEGRSKKKRIFPLFDGKLGLFHPQRINLSPISDVRKNSIFSMTNQSNSVLVPVNNSPKALNYEKNETDVRFVSVELIEDRALIRKEKHRTGMKVNSIYSREHWNTKDEAPIFLTDLNQHNFQRAYSLPTGTHTPSSENRVNLRRSARGEPPPHPARLRKNRHGWTLHFARPLYDATGCTRSILLLLIAIVALLGIGGIALYILFEPEKLEIIQQYLRSSRGNSTTERNSTFAPSLLPYEANLEIRRFSASNAPFLTEDVRTELPRETRFEPPTTTEMILDRNSTRHCDDCYNAEVCVALVDEEVPICRTGPDPLDPTGCSGLCLINKQKCHRLDVDAFRCVEVEHYCLDDEWTCSNTLCIPLVKHCDGHMNCYDHSDEYDCACDLQTHFQCGNETSCLPLDRRCNGKIDCWDATDEINCTLGQDLGWSCPSSSEFTCSNGECILKARFCDGLRDCTDGSDEPHGCQGRCNKHEYSCLNGRCITKSMKCNGIDDCGDNSDEQHCRNRIFKKPAA